MIDTPWTRIAVAMVSLIFLLGRQNDACSAGRHPNILLITADNLGYGDVGCYGSSQIKTPHLDRLGQQGVRCTDFYTASPTCSASRAALLTGRYPQRNGLADQLSKEENMGVGLRHGEVLIAELLRTAGYRTACFGKWNIGFAPGSRPTERGFDEYFGHASGNIDYYTHVYAGRNDLFCGIEPVEVEGYSTDLFAGAACDFIRRHADRRFFVYLPFNAPHFPQRRNKRAGEPAIWQAPAEAFDAYGYDPNEQDERKRYCAVVTALDAGIGRVLAQLDALGLADDTLVIFFSDNGAFMLPGRGLEVASNGPLRDGGVTVYEGGLRIPCLVRWPGRIPAGGLCREPLISLDFFAMILNAAGAELPADRTIDGRDPTAALSGEAGSPHEALFFEFRGMGAVRCGRYKLLRPAYGEPFALYDLREDIGETEDISGDHPELTARLRRAFDEWREMVTE